jgi:hypothetical protein
MIVLGTKCTVRRFILNVLVIMKILTRASQVLVLRNSVQSQIVSLLMLFIEDLVTPHDTAVGGGNLCV